MCPDDSRARALIIRSALLVAGLFVVVRVIFLSQILRSPVPRFPILDSRYYYEWAVWLAGGHGHPPGPFWLSPLYPAFLAGLFKSSGSTSPVVVMVVQCLLSLGTLTLIALLTRRLFGNGAAVTTAVLGALCAPWLCYDGVLLSASLILFLNALLLYLLYARGGASAGGSEPEPARGYGVWIALGALCGLSALARPSILIFGAALLVWLILHVRTRRWWKPAFFAGAVLLVLAPVYVRNYAVSGSLVLTTSSGGVNFFIGNRAGATGMYDELDFVPSFDPTREAEGYRAEASQRVGKTLTLNEASRYWGGQALRDIRQDPAAWIRLLVKKLWLTLQREELPTNISFRGVAAYAPILGALPVRWGILLPLAVAGALLVRKRSGLHLLWLYAASYLVVNMLFFSASEYRFPLLVVLLPLSGTAIVEARGLIVQGNIRRFVMICGAYLLALLACNFPSSEVARATRPRSDFYNMATVARDQGLVIETVPLYARSLALDPSFRDARLGLANALWILGNFDDARREFALAGVAAPDSVSGAPIEAFLSDLYLHTEDNDYPAALALLDSVFPSGRDAPQSIWAARAMVESGLGHPERAIDALLHAWAKEPDSPEWPYRAAVLALAARDTVRADSFFTLSSLRHGAYAPARIGRANLALTRGDTSTARGELDELRRIRIPEDSVRAQVDSLAARLGQGSALLP